MSASARSRGPEMSAWMTSICLRLAVITASRAPASVYCSLLLITTGAAGATVTSSASVFCCAPVTTTSGFTAVLLI